MESTPKNFVVYFKDQYVNIPADRMEKNDCYVSVYKDEKLVGLFPIMCIDLCYLSQPKNK